MTAQTFAKVKREARAAHKDPSDKRLRAVIDAYSAVEQKHKRGEPEYREAVGAMREVELVRRSTRPTETRGRKAELERLSRDFPSLNWEANA